MSSTRVIESRALDHYYGEQSRRHFQLSLVSSH